MLVHTDGWTDELLAHISAQCDRVSHKYRPSATIQPHNNVPALMDVPAWAGNGLVSLLLHDVTFRPVKVYRKQKKKRR